MAKLEISSFSDYRFAIVCTMAFFDASFLLCSYLTILFVFLNGFSAAQGEENIAAKSDRTIVCVPIDFNPPLVHRPRDKSDVEVMLRCTNLTLVMAAQTKSYGHEYLSHHFLCHSMLLFLLVTSIVWAIYQLAKDDFPRIWQKLRSFKTGLSLKYCSGKDAPLQMLDDLENGFLQQTYSDSDYQTERYFASSSDINNDSYLSSTRASCKQKSIQTVCSSDNSCITTPSPSLDSSSCVDEITFLTHIENEDDMKMAVTSTPIKDYVALEDFFPDLSLIQNDEDCDDEVSSLTTVTSLEDWSPSDDSLALV